VKFFTDENGKVTHLIHSLQNGLQTVAKKLKDEVPAKVDPALFDKYVGKYYNMGNQAILEVLKEGDKLMIQVPDLPKYQLLPASETEYFTKEMSLRLTFKINPEGQAGSFVLNTSGIETTAKRLAR